MKGGDIEMLKNVFILALVSLIAFSAAAVYADQNTNQPTAAPLEKTKDRASRAMNNIFYGPVEVPANLDETKTKGTKMDRCSEKTRTGVERGLARMGAGIWQLATFWYSDPNGESKPVAKTSSSNIK